MEKYVKTMKLAGTRSLSFATGWATRYLWGISSTGISNYPLWILINLRFSSTGEGRCCWAAPYDVRRNAVVVVVEYRRLGPEKEVGQQRPSRAREEPPELLRIGTPTAMIVATLLRRPSPCRATRRERVGSYRTTPYGMPNQVVAGMAGSAAVATFWHRCPCRQGGKDPLLGFARRSGPGRQSYARTSSRHFYDYRICLSLVVGRARSFSNHIFRFFLHPFLVFRPLGQGQNCVNDSVVPPPTLDTTR
jgi:hypothetical protein